MTAEWICFIRDGAFYRIVIKIRWDIYFSLLYVNITTSTTTAMQSYQELYTHKCILAHISINISTFPQSICICRGSRGGWWGRSRTWRRSRPRQRSRTRRGTCRCRTPGPIRGGYCSHVTSIHQSQPTLYTDASQNCSGSRQLLDWMQYFVFWNYSKCWKWKIMIRCLSYVQVLNLKILNLFH